MFGQRVLVAERSQLRVWKALRLRIEAAVEVRIRELEIRNREQEYALISEGKTPQGIPVKKITVLAGGDRWNGNEPWVKKHVVMDLRTNAVIASAEIKRAKRVQAESGWHFLTSSV